MRAIPLLPLVILAACGLTPSAVLPPPTEAGPPTDQRVPPSPPTVERSVESPPPPGSPRRPPPGGPPAPGGRPPSTSGSSGAGPGNIPFAPVATDLSHWRGSPPQMVAAAAASDASRVAFAQQIGAVMDISVNPSTLSLVWTPPGGAKGVIVTLHGHGATAYDELQLWYPYAKERQLAIVAIQWWDTLFESEADYLPPDSVYKVVSESVHKHFGVTPPPVLLHGFSRGSAQIFGVAAYDRVATVPMVKGVIANAGGVEASYPNTISIEAGAFGPQPFSGMKWVLACGGRDRDPERCGCPAMERTRTWIEKHGGVVTILEDAQASHGSFQKDTVRVGAALDTLLGG